MFYQYIPYIWPLILSSITSLSLGVFVFLRRRSAKGAASFVLSMLVVTIWSSANALEMASINLEAKLLWANMQYFAYCYSPVTLLALCLQFTGFDELIRSKKVLWFALLPTIVLILVWTDHIHGLIRYNITLDNAGMWPVIAKEYGPMFYVHAAYSHLLNITAWFLLIRTVFFQNTIYKRQAIALLVGVSFIIIPNVLYISGISPFTGFDLTPVLFGPAGAIVAWGIFRYKLFDIIPIARAAVIEKMTAGVLVLDNQNRVLDINISFAEMVGFPALSAPTKPLEEVCGKYPVLISICLQSNLNHCEFTLNMNGTTRIYDSFISTLSDKSGASLGKLIVVYDITKDKQAQQEYLAQQSRLAATEEREKLARDMHDNLGQLMGFINMQAQAIRQELLQDPRENVLPKLDRLVEVARSAHDQIRDYIRDVRQIGAVSTDFLGSLTKLFHSFQTQSGIRAQMAIPRGFSGEELPLSVRTNIINIIREALNNITKHAQATSVRLVLSASEDELCFTVEDDGKGFDTVDKEASTSNGFGLQIMQERAFEIGASIVIESAKGVGSRVLLSIPRGGGGACQSDEGIIS